MMLRGEEEKERKKRAEGEKEERRRRERKEEKERKNRGEGEKEERRRRERRGRIERDRGSRSGNKAVPQRSNNLLRASVIEPNNRSLGSLIMIRDSSYTAQNRFPEQ